MEHTNNNNSQDKKIITRKGDKNPMFGRHHSYETKQKMSQSHKKHYAAIKHIADQQTYTYNMSEIRHVIKELITEYMMKKKKSSKLRHR
jgi:hypothetical protein